MQFNSDTMKVFSIIAMLLGSASAFSPMKQPTTQSSTSLQAAKPANKWTPAVVAATLTLGLTLASPLPSVADTDLDFSLPSYDTKMSGFGDGTEARLSRDGPTEKDRQAEALRKAEENRKELAEKKKAEAKARLEEDKRRAKEKKARDAERLKNIWNS